MSARPCLLALTLCACGARSPIPECVEEGQLRDCSNVCGSGVQVCHHGWWSACKVPDRTRSCTNLCGPGTELCHAGAWQACRVAPTRIACTNDCGDGTQSCVDGQTGVCEVPQKTRTCSSVCGTGTEYCDNGQWHGCDAPAPKPPTLTCVIRDFHQSHPDMELDYRGNVDDRGVVASVLGSDDKPVYLPVDRTITTSGKANFDQWFRNVADVNLSTTYVVTLSEDPRQPGVWGYDNRSFFPIDNQLFGNEGNFHNFHFTVQIATTFRYAGGEIFTYSGDDDVWVFINRRLAIDLGGIHEIETQTVSLDSSASSLDLSPGNVYPMHIFFAERHTVASDFVLQTSLTEFAVCD